MASMKFDHSRTGEFSVNTRVSGPEISSKDGRSVAAAFPLSVNTSDSAVSGIFSNVDVHGFFRSANNSAYKLSHDHGQVKFSCSMISPSMAASAGRSAFSCSSESPLEHATRSDVSSPAQENTRDGEATLTEHDYIGLSEAATTASSERALASGVREGGIPDLNLGETELRLGPPKAFRLSRSDPSNERPFPEEDMEPFSGTHDERQSFAASCEQISCRGEGLVSSFRDGATADRSQVPVTGAKRGFAAVICSQFAEESTSAAQIAPIDTVSSRSTTDSETKHMRSRLMPPAYPWGVVNQMPPTSSRPMDLDQTKAPFQPFPSAMSLQEQQKYKTLGEVGASSSLKDSNAKPWDSGGKRMSDTSYDLESASYGREDGHDMPEDDSENAPASSSPVVGWPPVQSFRNKALSAQPQPKSTNERQVLPAAATSPDTPPGSTLVDSFFVKVYMDGVTIGRKVDLKSSNSYEKLSLVLEEMFRRFISGNGRAQKSITGNIAIVKENRQRNFIYGSDQYVLAYKDKDGDLMLVGDVPWSMFVVTVKRLRIMKGSDAIGLAPKAKH